MKRIGVVSTPLLLCALLGVTAFGYAQERQAEKQGKPDKQAATEKQKPQQKPQHAQPQQRQQQAEPQQRPQQQPRQAQPQQRPQQQPQQAQPQQRPQYQPQQAQPRQQSARYAPPRSQMRRTPQQQHSQEIEQRGFWQQHRARDFRAEHRSWSQRGGYDGYRIPDVYYHASYGQNHWFRIFGLPFMMVGGYPRFQYGGYWFNIVEPYPDYWGANWYQTDDVFVAYSDDGYYLYNRRYPSRPGIAISIVF